MPITYPAFVNADAITSGTLRLESLPLQWVASDNLRHNNDTERFGNNAAYTKIKEINIDFLMKGTLRLKFDIRSNIDTHISYAKIYLNGVAIGTEQSTSSSTYSTKSEDIALNLHDGDLLQIYVKQAADESVYIQNFKICGDPTTFASVHTNQDP